MDNTYRPVCKTVGDLEQCMMCDPANIPTVQANLRNIITPVGQDDVTFLSGEDSVGTQVGVDFFANPSNTPETPGTFSRSPGVIRSGLRFRTDFVLDSICIMLHCEPNAWALDGNQFFTQALIDAASQLPFSPVNAWGGACSTGISNVTMCMAQLEHGGPTVRAAHWALQTYRLALQCPSSANVHEIMNERLIDLGNCCLGTEYQGYGESEASEIYAIRKVNTRLKDLLAANQMPIIEGLEGATSHNYEPGYFMPFNTIESLLGPGPVCRRAPTRMSVADEAYGSPMASPGSYKWYRLPMPRIIKHDENIEILLKMDPNDKMFFLRMLHELALHPCASPIPGITGTQIVLNDGTYTAAVDGKYIRIPSGTLRFGIGLKGWMLDANLCGNIVSRFNDMTYEQFLRTKAGACRVAGPVQVAMQGPSLPLEQVAGLTGCGCKG